MGVCNFSVSSCVYGRGCVAGEKHIAEGNDAFAPGHPVRTLANMEVP